MANILLFMLVVISTCWVVSVNSLQAENCYDYGTLPIEIRRLRVSPSTIQIPGVTSVRFEVIVREDIGTNSTHIAASISMSRVLNIRVGWLSYQYEIPVPCLDVGDGIQVGSCDYPDVCLMVEKLNNQTGNAQCEEAAQYGLPCECPISAATYSTGRRYIEVDLTQGVDQIPSSVSMLLEGEYVMTVEIYDSLDYTGRLLGCFDVTYEISID